MNRVRDYNMPQITGFDNGCPILAYPYANLNTVTNVDTFRRRRVRHVPNDWPACLSRSTPRRMEIRTTTLWSFRFADGCPRVSAYNLGYTFSHGLANFGDNLTTAQLPQNSYNYGAEMSNSILDIRSRFVGNFVWDLPFGQGKRFLPTPVLRASGWAMAVQRDRDPADWNSVQRHGPKRRLVGLYSRGLCRLHRGSLRWRDHRSQQLHHHRFSDQSRRPLRNRDWTIRQLRSSQVSWAWAPDWLT